MPNFEIDVKKTGWTPQSVEQLVDIISRAFEQTVTIDQLQIFGTDHVNRTRIQVDRDIQTFLQKESMTKDQAFKLKLPPQFLPSAWEPKKVKILCKGGRIAKYFGDEKVSTRQVQFSVKLFDCGHFYMKQTLGGSGASPYWVIFEGTWTRTERGMCLEYKFRYAWQTTKTPDLDFAIEALPRRHSSALSWCGEGERQLNGEVPAIVGQEPFCRVELCREADKVERGRARMNVEEKPAPTSGTAKPPLSEEERIERRRRRNELLEAQELDARRRAAEQQRERAAAESRRRAAEADDEEPIWPMYLGLFLLAMIFVAFAWVWWEDRKDALAEAEGRIVDDEF